MTASAASSESTATICLCSMRMSSTLRPGSCARRRAVPARTIAAPTNTREASCNSRPRRVFCARVLVRVIAPIEWRRCVRKDLVVGDVVAVDVIARGAADDWRAYPKIADECRHRNVDHVVAKAAPVRPAAGDSATAEPLLDLAGQHVPAENAQTREPRVIGVERVRCATA